MLCERCGKAEAKVHYIENRKCHQPERHLCRACAEAEDDTVAHAFSGVPENEDIHISKSYNVIVKSPEGHEISREVDAELPELERVKSGLDALNGAILRIVASVEPNPGVNIFVESKKDFGPAILTLGASSGGIGIGIMLTSHNLPDDEGNIRRFMADKAAPLVREFGTVTKFTPRHLRFSLPGSQSDVTTLVRGLLQVAFGVGDQDKIQLTFIRC